MEEKDINEFIEIQQKPVFFYIIYSVALVLAGIIIIFWGPVFIGKDHADTLKTVTTLGGGFISALSSFPIKEILNRKEKIQTVRKLSSMLQKNTSNTFVSSTQDVQSINARINEELWKFIFKPLTA